MTFGNTIQAKHMRRFFTLFIPLIFLFGLPVSAAPVNILPLGDSITDGAGYNEPHSSYRDELYNLLTDAGYDFNFVGTRSSSYGSITLKHEGVSSIRADQILNGGLGQAPLNNKLTQYGIDIVLLHAGTNDILQGYWAGDNTAYTASTTLADIENIIAALKLKSANSIILVAKVIPNHEYNLANGDLSIPLNSLLSNDWAQSLSTNSFKVIIVDHHSDMQSGTQTNDYATDFIHPNQSGETKMANKWFDALKELDLLANQLRSDPDLTITAPSSVNFGNDITLATSSKSNAEISYTSTSPTICSANQQTITAVTSGACTIFVEQAANNDYLAVSQSVAITILEKKDQTISLAAAKQKITITKKIVLKATSTSGLTTFTYSSSTPNLCNVTANTVTALAAGKCKLTASQAGNNEYKAATSPVKIISIEKKLQTVDLITPNEAKTGKDFAVSAKASSSLAVKISSVTPNICKITKNKVKPLKKGICIINASQAGNTTFKAVNNKKTITITEPKKAGSITVFPLFLLGLFGFISRKLSRTTELTK